MMLDNNNLRQLMSEVNKSFYVYDEEEILKSINILKDQFKEFEILYSVKTNPNKHILNLMSKNNIGQMLHLQRKYKYQIQQILIKII